MLEGLLVVILISIVIGKYGALQDFARREAIASLRGWGAQVSFIQIINSGEFLQTKINKND